MNSNRAKQMHDAEKGIRPGAVKESNKIKKKLEISVDSLIHQGMQALQNMNPNLALKFYERALTMKSDDTNLMDALADVHIQLGDQEKALLLLNRSTQLAPTVNPYKWLYLAQLQRSEEALLSYRQGIELLILLLVQKQEEIDNGNESNPELSTDVLKKQICKAFSSIADLYLTDLCYEEGAEVLCEESIMKALEIDIESLDAHQSLVSLRLSQSRNEEACNIIFIVYTKLTAIRDEINARTVMEDLDDQDEPIEVPEIDFCISTAKLLIECGATQPNLCENAMDLIADLLQQDDENIELWYIMGVAALGATNPDKDVARYHFDTAKGMMDRIKKELDHSTPNGTPFHLQDQYNLVIEHLALLDTMHSDSNDKEDDKMTGVFDDEEWSDCDEEDEIMESK